MGWINIPLPKFIYKPGDETQLSGPVGARLVNGFIDEFGHFRKRPGLTEFADLGTGGISGLYWWDKKQVVIGVRIGNVHKITDSNGTNSDVTGDKLASTGKVSFATDGTTLIMANGAEMVTYDNSGTTDKMSDVETGSGTWPTTVQNVRFLDGYLLAVNTAEDGEVDFSSPLDILDFTSSDLFTAETDPDPIQYMDTRWDEITLFGKTIIDVYYNDGFSPFTKLGGAITHKGWIAKDSIVETELGWIGLDDRRRISILQGRQAQSISTPFDNEIRDIIPVSNADGMLVDFGSQEFYIITFPDNQKTYAYDTKLNSFTEWGTWDGSHSFEKFKGINTCYAKAWDKTLIGDRTNGKVYELDDSNFQDDGENIHTVLRTSHIDHGTSLSKWSKAIRIRVKRGTGGLATNPEFTLRWRDENGAWSNTYAFDLGRAGDTDFYIEKRPMGIYRTRQYEIRHADNSDFILIGIDEDVEVLNR